MEQLSLGSACILARDSEARDNYPYRNKIGEIYKCDDGSTSFIGWGYAWAQPDGTDCTDRVYLEKTNIWNGSSEIRDSLAMNSEEIQVLKAESDIEYVPGQYLRKHSKFDEESRDLVYDSGEWNDSESE